jgi:NAD+--asparagine ADP-ribosyltransferase
MNKFDKLVNRTIKKVYKMIENGEAYTDVNLSYKQWRKEVRIDIKKTERLSKFE